MSPWHTDPDLAPHLHPDFPDDVRVIVHDGEPRRTGTAPELCWVRIEAQAGELHLPARPAFGDAPAAGPETRRVYRGTLLNTPHGLRTIGEGDALLFVAVAGLDGALRVTSAYLAERPAWTLSPCSGCGADQALDPPSVMARTRFGGMGGGSVEMFTAFCFCGGTQALARLDREEHDPAPRRRPWWKFWA